METVTLSANALLTYKGMSHAAGMQFLATKADADKLIESGQASLAVPSVKPQAVGTKPA